MMPKFVKEIKATHFVTTAKLYEDIDGFYLEYLFPPFFIRLPHNPKEFFLGEKSAKIALDHELNQI